MTPQQYRRAQNAITADLRRVLLPLLRLLRGRPTDEQWQAFLTAAYPAVYRARVQSWQLAADFYASQRRAQLAPARRERDEATPEPSGGDDEPVRRAALTAVDGGGQDEPEIPRRNYPPQALAAAMRPVRARLETLDEGDPLPEPVADAAVRTAERHARDAGREAVVDATRHDRRALGYARRALSANPCAFCLMLVSRGPVYKNANTALRRDGGGEPYHDGCSCLAVPVFNRERWPGRQEYEQLERDWRQHGGTLADWRHYLDAQRQQPGDDRRPQAA